MNADTPKFSICLGRQLGSGGSEIARFLADQLGFKFYDKELLSAAAAKSGYSHELFEQSDEEKSNIHRFFTQLIPFVGAADYYGNPANEDSLFRILSDTILSLVDEENCIFVGRCAEYILRNHRDSICSLFISADMPDRIDRISRLRNISADAARKAVNHCDKRRAAFHDFYCNHQWGHAATYDLCINSSVFGIETTKQLVLQAIKSKFNL